MILLITVMLLQLYRSIRLLNYEYCYSSVRIVNPDTNEEVPPGVVGEVWISGPSTTAGYFSLPQKTKDVYNWKIFDKSTYSDPIYCRTGDSGFMHDGELFIAGRFKDMIIIRGRNYYPQDIEEAAEHVQQIRPGCSVAMCLTVIRNGEAEETLGICAEIRPDKESEGLTGFFSKLFVGNEDKTSSLYESIAKDISKEVAKQIGIPVQRIWLVSPRTVPKTSSGKVRRSLTRDKLLSRIWTDVLYDSGTSLRHDAGGQKSSQQTSCYGEDDFRSFGDDSEHKSPPVESFDIQLSHHISRTAATGHQTTARPICHAANVERVRQAVLNAAKAVLESEEIPEFDAPLYELGIDSIGAVEFSEVVSNELNLEIEPTLMFNYPTLNDIISFLAQELDGKDGVQLVFSSSESESDESLAILSTSVNLPGAARSLASFWSLLCDKTNCVSEVPRSRWDPDDYFDADPDAEGKMYIKDGGFIEDAEMFDAAFFRISPSEARSMDPQQRLLLEGSYEALCASGYRKESLHRSNIGVFIGCCSNDWVYVSQTHNHQLQASSYSATSQAPSILSNRISYSLGMTGPSLTVDTACSSSLVAVHIAARELRAGTCSAAVVAGVNLILAPEITIAFCKARMMAPDARCKTFDAAANGYVRGEGVGVLVLKSKSRAEKDGNIVLGYVRGSAINHGGRAASLTAPSGPAQQNVILSALHQSKLTPDSVHFVETHGTGTALGDPIEVGALKAVFAAGRSENSPLILGAVKTNIGHLEGASGIAGLLKALLVLRYRQVPPNLHFRTLNPHIDAKGFPMAVPTVQLPLLNSTDPTNGTPTHGLSILKFVSFAYIPIF